MTGKHMNFVRELTALALTGLPAITSPCFVLTGELEEWTKIEDHVTGRICNNFVFFLAYNYSSLLSKYDKLTAALGLNKYVLLLRVELINLM